MAEQRIGRQTPTQSVVMPYKDTKGPEAGQLYYEQKMPYSITTKVKSSTARWSP